MSNTANAVFGLESFKGEKVVTYLGLALSVATLVLLWQQWQANKAHMALQSELAKAQLSKIKNGGTV